MAHWRDRGESVSTDDRPSLENVFEYYGIHLGPRQGNQMVRCPVHDERRSSCSVNLDRGLWHCMACGARGSSWDLIMQKEGVDFRGARTFATDHSFTEGGTDGGGTQVQVSAYTGRTRKTGNSGTPVKNGGYLPSWRR